MLDVFTIFGRLKAAWDSAQAKRRDKLRPVLYELAHAAHAADAEPNTLAERYLDKALEASLPLGEVGGDLLRGAAAALEGAK